MKMQGVNTYHPTAKVSIHKQTVCKHTCIFKARSHFIMTLDFFNYCSLSALYHANGAPRSHFECRCIKS